MHIPSEILRMVLIMRKLCLWKFFGRIHAVTACIIQSFEVCMVVIAFTLVNFLYHIFFSIRKWKIKRNIWQMYSVRVDVRHIYQYLIQKLIDNS